MADSRHNHYDQIIERGEAWIGTSYKPDSGSLWIGYVSVPEGERRRGIGSLLLDRAVELGEAYNAIRITAEIVSREGLELMRDYFGQEALNVENEGTFEGETPPVETAAFMNYFLLRR